MAGADARRSGQIKYKYNICSLAVLEWNIMSRRCSVRFMSCKRGGESVVSVPSNSRNCLRTPATWWNFWSVSYKFTLPSPQMYLFTFWASKLLLGLCSPLVVCWVTAETLPLRPLPKDLLPALQCQMPQDTPRGPMSVPHHTWKMPHTSPTV